MIKSLLAFATLAIMSTCAAADDRFKLTSPDISGGSFSDQHLADTFGCTGANISPALEWSGAPEGTLSFSVAIYDPDAPTGSGFWHWIVTDIPASAEGLPSGAGTSNDLLPQGSQPMKNDAGVTGYLGACPPAGETHRYIITVKALGVEKLPVSPDASGAMIGFVTNANLLSSASLEVTGSN